MLSEAVRPSEESVKHTQAALVRTRAAQDAEHAELLFHYAPVPIADAIARTGFRVSKEGMGGARGAACTLWAEEILRAFAFSTEPSC